MRPKKELNQEVKDTKFQFLLSSREKELWEKAAIKLKFNSLSEYIRHVMNSWSRMALESEK